MSQIMSAQGPRAFNDITNNEAVVRPVLEKSKSRSSSLQSQVSLNAAQSQQYHLQSRQQQGPLLSQQAFSDPSLIDDARSFSSGKGVRCWNDVDAANMDDPQSCAPYATIIFHNMRQVEVQRRPNPAYLDEIQNDMNSKMRAILVDWLVEVCDEYKLCADTLYLTINYVDRFLSKHQVPRSQLQLVGVACMWVAAKYEEIYPPNVNDFIFITDSTYTKQQLVKMEEMVLKKLSYELTMPTTKTFLRRLLQVCSPDELLHFLSNYLTELSLLDHVMMQYLPSQIAAASVYLANLMLRRPGWDTTLQHYSTYAPNDFLPCVRALALLHMAVASSSSLTTIKTKYGSSKFQSVSRIPISSTLMQQLGI